MEYYDDSMPEPNNNNDEESDGFMEGYMEEDKVLVCAECGSAIEDEKGIEKDIEGEKKLFCSTVCAQEFKESM